MGVLLGGFLGTVAGLGTWLVAREFVERGPSGGDAPDPRTDAPAGPLLRSARGAIIVPAALMAAGMALWGAYLGWQAPGPGQAAATLLITGLLLSISLVDFQVRRIPDPLVLALLLGAAIQALWLGVPPPLAAALGLAAGGGVFLLVAWLGRGAMGMGDVKLAAALGALLGFPLIVSGLLLGALAGGLAALALLATRRAGRKDMMAYGPYLALGAWIVWTRSLGLWA
jgi:leader peptidase (prepilin peptidase)/N-methyltransferase